MNTWLAFTSYRRATTDTDAPATSVSAGDHNLDAQTDALKAVD